MNRYIIGILAFLGLAILLIVLLIPSHSHKKPPAPLELPAYANTQAYVEVDIDGPIVAPTNHSSVEITVSNSSANVYWYQGYNGAIKTSTSFANTESSYENFLYALYYAGFTEGTTSPYKSDIGLCADGDKYDLYLINDGQTIEHYWSTQCSGEPKTFSGNLSMVLSLFDAQIPNIYTITSGANI